MLSALGPKLGPRYVLVALKAADLGAIVAGHLVERSSWHFHLGLIPKRSIWRLSWERTAAKADWAPRNSAISLVHNDRMWLMGGWLGMQMSTPTDVWSSKGLPA